MHVNLLGDVHRKAGIVVHTVRQSADTISSVWPAVTENSFIRVFPSDGISLLLFFCCYF